MRILGRRNVIARIGFCATSILLLTLGAATQKTFADSANDKDKQPPISNLGFMENPPQELREKFSMCDAFLKVEWINKKERIGAVSYDLYKNDKKIKAAIHALVYISDTRQGIDCDLGEQRRNGRFRNIYGHIKKGRLTFDVDRSSCFVGIEYKENGVINVDELSYIDAEGATLAEHRMNICLIYPDNLRAWIVEGNEISKIYKTQLVEEKLNMLKEFAPRVVSHGISNVIEIEVRGKKFYLGGGGLAYQVGSRYFEIEPISEESDVWRFPPTQNTCSVSFGESYFLTSDGTSLYLNNKCNIAELIKVR